MQEGSENNCFWSAGSLVSERSMESPERFQNPGKGLREIIATPTETFFAKAAIGMPPRFRGVEPGLLLDLDIGF